MKIRSPTDKMLAILLVTLLLAAGWPAASATHVNDTVMVPRPSQLLPPSVFDPIDDLIDNAAGGALGELDKASASLNDALRERLSEPELPATYFVDLFDGNRIGGSGAWMSATDAPVTWGSAWQLATTGGRDAIVFGDASGYAVGSSGQLATFLISPRISLDALPVDSPTGNDACGPQQATVPGGQSAVPPVTSRCGNHPLVNSIQLNLTHRYHFDCRVESGAHDWGLTGLGIDPPHFDHILCDGTPFQPLPGLSGPRLVQDDVTVTARDYGRVWLFLDTPPTALDVRNPSNRGQTLSHNENQPDGIGSTQFGGSRDAFYNTTFNLTPWAGRDAWILFEANAQAKSPATFLNDERFNRSLPFYGWQIDDVRIEGPAWARNVKIDELLHPATLTRGLHTPVAGQQTEAILAVAPGEDQQPLGMLLLNRGQTTTDVRPMLTLNDDAGQTRSYPTTPATIALRPGQTEPYLFEESVEFLGEGRYEAVFEAHIVDGAPDLYPTDNRLDVRLLSHRAPQVTAPSLFVTPSAGDSNDVRTVTAILHNAGNGIERVDLDLSISYREPGAIGAQDFTPPGFEPARPVTLDPGERRPVEWEILLDKPGSYHFFLEGVMDLPAPYDPVTFDATTEAVTLVGMDPVYETSFEADDESLDQWLVEHAGDVLPPCDDEPDVCMEKDIWEMPAHCSQQCKTLIAYVDTAELDYDLETEIASFRIEVTQWLDAPCRVTLPPYVQSSLPKDPLGNCWANHAGGGSGSPGNTQPQTGVDNRNQRPLLIQLQHQVGSRTAMVNVEQHRFDAPISAPTTHAGNRIHHYDQWLEDSYQVSSLQLNQQTQANAQQGTIPIGLLDDALSLRFIGQVLSGTNPMDPCGDNSVHASAELWHCPSWRIASATVIGTTPAGQDIPLLLWDGEEELGTWAEGTMLQQEADNAFWERDLPENIPLEGLSKPVRDALAEANDAYVETVSGPIEPINQILREAGTPAAVIETWDDVVEPAIDEFDERLRGQAVPYEVLDAWEGAVQPAIEAFEDSLGDASPPSDVMTAWDTVVTAVDSFDDLLRTTDLPTEVVAAWDESVRPALEDVGEALHEAGIPDDVLDNVWDAYLLVGELFPNLQLPEQVEALFADRNLDNPRENPLLSNRQGLSVPPTGWITREFADLLEASTANPGTWDGADRFNSEPWQLVTEWGQKQGVWTNANGPKDNGKPISHTDWTSSDRQASLLETPKITIPSGAGAPVLQFDHRFHFLSSGGSQGWLKDHGTLLVRFWERDEHSPWLQVAVRYNHSFPLNPLDASRNGLMQEVQRFYGQDCVYYNNHPHYTEHPDGDACNAQNPNRNAVTETLPLSQLPVLDYRLAGGAPTGDVDRNALRLVDLRDGTNIVFNGAMPAQGPALCNGECTVQFGFRAQTGQHSPGVYSQTSAVGWYINRLQVLPFPVLAHDITMVDADLITDYDWTEVGLGPGDDQATLQVEVRNDGLFQQPVPGGSISIRVKMQAISSDGSAGDILSQDYLLEDTFLRGVASGATAAERTLKTTLDIALPDEPGKYRFQIEAVIGGKILNDDVVDGASFNNCAGIIPGPGGTPTVVTGDCSISALAPLSVRATPRFTVGVDVEPRAATASDLPREIPITITNQGNVPMEGLSLTRSVRYQGQSTEAPGTIHSRIDLDSPPVGGTLTLLEAIEASSQTPGFEDYYVSFPQDARYRVTVCLTLPGEAACHAQDSLVVESFRPLYVDDFKADPARNGRVAPSGEIGPADPDGPWGIVEGTGVLGEGRGWHFGDLDRETYPNGAEESLMLPPLDLSVARLASIALSHMYDFEEGYDGGRLEASLDGGQTWRPLLPSRGYVSRTTGEPATVYDGNPMESEGDPTAVTPAWTGSSGGWTTDEFNLGQLPEIVSEALLYEFDEQAYPSIASLGELQGRPVPGETEWQRASYARSWTHPPGAGGSCSSDPAVDPLLEQCWYRENVHMGTPAPNPAGHPEHDGKYWWTGMPTRNEVVSPWAGEPRDLRLTVTLPPREDGLFQLTFWRWHDASVGHMGTFYVWDQGQGGWNYMTPVDTSFSVENRGDWQRYTLNMGRYQGQQEASVKVRFCVEAKFDNKIDGLACDEASNGVGDRRPFRGRGAVLDNVRLEKVDGQGDLLEIVNRYPPDATDSWENGPPASVGKPWSAIKNTGPSPESIWNIRSVSDRNGNLAKTFAFGDPSGGSNYPNDAKERLVTPIIDLVDVGGTQARASFWEAYKFPSGLGNDPDQDHKQRRVWVQTIQPTLEGGEVPGPWAKLFDSGDDDPALVSDKARCEGDPPAPVWCLHELDLSEFIGQKIRIGFEIRTDSSGNLDAEGKKGYWAIDDLRVFADVFAGAPLLLRLRAASDNSVGDGGWTIDHVGLVGYSYENNIAILLDDPADDYRIAPGETIRIKGTVRNLGERTTNLLNLQATAEPLNGEATLGLRFENAPSNAQSVLSDTGFSLQSPGLGSDEIPFELELAAPAGSNGDRFRVELDAVEVAAGGIRLDPLADEVLGDHRRVLTVVVDDVTLLSRVEPTANPLTADPGEPVVISLGLENVGTRVTSAHVKFTVIELATGLSGAPSIEQESEAILPGDKDHVSWTWTPPSGAKGFFQVKSEVKPAGGVYGNPEDIGLVLVGQRPIYFQEGFEADSLPAAGWSSSQACGQGLDCWRLRNFAFAGAQSAYIGPVNPLDGSTHNSNQDVRLAGPKIDLRSLDLLSDPTFRQSPFNPQLTFRYQGNLGDNDGLVVEACVADVCGQGDWRYLDSAAYDGQLLAGNAANPGNPLATRIPGPVYALTGDVPEWRSATVPLGPTAPNGTSTGLHGGDKLVGTEVSPAFRFGSAIAGNRGQTLHVDAVTVSSYASSLAPQHRAVSLTTGADKVFHILVNNTGPTRDTYQVRLLDSHLTVFQAEVLDSVLELEAGQSRLIRVRVIAPASDLGRGAGGLLVLEVTSAGDPNAVSTAALDLTYISSPLPDLDVTLARPDGSGDLTAGDQTSLLATVTNTDRLASSRPTMLDIGICPWITGSLESDLATCRSDGTWILLAKQDLPMLLPAQMHTGPPVTWKIPEDLAGRFHLVVEADPAGLIREGERGNNVFALPVDVSPLDRPHLRVAPGSLQVTRDGEPVHHAIDGDLLRITGTVENIGSKEALGAMVRLVNQFPILEEDLDRLGPGESISFSSQWRAEPGNWIVLLEIIPGLEEQHRSSAMDLAARWDLAVERSHVEATIDPPTVALPPGVSWPVFLSISSDRSGTTPLIARVVDAEDVNLTGLPVHIALDAFVEVPLTVTVSPFAKDGMRTLRVDLHTDPDAPAIASAGIDVDVGNPRPVSIKPVPLVTPVGTERLQFAVTNHGGRSATPQLMLEVPAGWRIATPPSITVPAGATQEGSVLLTIPEGTAPGHYVVSIHADGKHAADAKVEVLPQPLWEAEVEYVNREGGALLAWLRIENVGNAPGIPFVQGDVEPPLRMMQPGEVQVYRLRLPAESTSLSLPGRQSPVDLPEPGAPGSVEVTRWDVSPRGASSGDIVRVKMELLNTRNESSPDYPVVLFINGFPAAEDTISLPAAGVASAEMSWVARSGQHALSVSHGPTTQETAFNEILDVSPSDRGVPATPVGLLVLLLAALGLARRSKRK